MEDNNETTENVAMTAEEIEAMYQSKFGLPTPDLIVGITPDGMAWGLIQTLYHNEIISPETQVTGLIADIEYKGSGGTLPIGIYINKESTKGLN